MVRSRLDYWNALYLFFFRESSSPPFRHLQLVQNNAARYVTGARKREHITPILASFSLHWLLVHFRVYLKILQFVFKFLNEWPSSTSSCCWYAWSPPFCWRLRSTLLISNILFKHHSSGCDRSRKEEALCHSRGRNAWISIYNIP